MEPDLAPVTVDAAELDTQPLDLDRLKLLLPDSDGKLHGAACRLVLKSGCVYTGELVRGAMQGKGKLVFPDGLEYEGSFERNAIQGTGIFRWPGGAVYEGEVRQGLRHGHGKMKFADSPVVYSGSWRAGKRHGRGRMTFNEAQTHWFEGEWVDDQKCGQGTMRYANDDEYVGAWANDVKAGCGTMWWASRQQAYTGSWAANAPNGFGTHVWYQQLVSEASPVNHAALLQFNRYNGQFVNGVRSGYGVLHYASGARYEGHWEADLKQGPGVYVFENGEAWAGDFQDDLPVLGAGEAFAPKSTNLCLQVSDLVDEEEAPAAAARGLANVLMAYNTELRSLYDKYCKRPSLHLVTQSGGDGSSGDLQRPAAFSMVTCQVWELLSDVRLVTAATPLSRCDQLLALARRPPTALASFRAGARTAAAPLPGSPAAAWWDALATEHVRGGPHAPMQPLQFRELCEFLVRLAGVRYRHVPALERRLHTLINVHLLHQVSKIKTATTLPAPPRTPFHAELWAGGATSALRDQEPLLRAAWARIPGGERPAAVVGGVAQHYAEVKTVRGAVQLLQQLGLLPSPDAAMRAAAALTFNYRTVNTYTYDLSRRVDVTAADAAPGAPEAAATETSDVAGGTPPAEVAEADAREVLCWLDQQMLYADWVEGIARVAQAVVVDAQAAATTLEEHVADEGVEAGEDAAADVDGLLLGVQRPGSEGLLHRQIREFLTAPETGLQAALERTFVPDTVVV